MSDNRLVKRSLDMDGKRRRESEDGGGGIKRHGYKCVVGIVSVSLLIKLQQLWEREGGKFLENVNWHSNGRISINKRIETMS